MDIKYRNRNGVRKTSGIQERRNKVKKNFLSGNRITEETYSEMDLEAELMIEKEFKAIQPKEMTLPFEVNPNSNSKIVRDGPFILSKRSVTSQSITMNLDMKAVHHKKALRQSVHTSIGNNIDVEAYSPSISDTVEDQRSGTAPIFYAKEPSIRESRVQSRETNRRSDTIVLKKLNFQLQENQEVNKYQHLNYRGYTNLTNYQTPKIKNPHH